MKTLKFTPDLAAEILAGRKTTTWRMFDDKDLMVGDRLTLVNKETGEPFTEVEVTGVTEKALQEIMEADFEGHGPVQSLEELLSDFQKYYGDQVTRETPVKIVAFKLV